MVLGWTFCLSFCLSLCLTVFIQPRRYSTSGLEAAAEVWERRVLKSGISFCLCLSILLSILLYVLLSLFLSYFLTALNWPLTYSIYLSVCLCLCLNVLSIVYLSMCISVSLSTCPFWGLSNCLSLQITSYINFKKNLFFSFDLPHILNRRASSITGSALQQNQVTQPNLTLN